MTAPLRIGILSCALVCACFSSDAQTTRHATQKHASPPSAEDRVDINAASLDQLLKVPGMTRTWAARIIRFRPYRAKNELIDRGVISEQVYARVKDHIIARRAGQ